MEITFIITLIASYLIGAIPCGVILTKLTGAGDVRNSGSGNIGATNVYRTAGRKLGILTLIGDIVKGVIPVVYAVAMADMTTEQTAMIACATFLGHLYPVYLSFKGGKGVATYYGVILGINWLVGLIALAIWLTMAALFKISSLSALVSIFLTPFILWHFSQSVELTATAALMSLIVFWRHQNNIKQLIQGTEERIDKN